MGILPNPKERKQRNEIVKRKRNRTMSKAEVKGYEAYPESFYEGTTVDVNEMPRNVFVEGYHQAEKDNELTWEDVEIIINAFLDFYIENKERGKEKGYNDKEYCVEVLKRFKERKEE